MPDSSRDHETNPPTHQDIIRDIPDQFFTALTNQRRRYILAYLSNETSNSATIQELVEDIAAREHDEKTDSHDDIEITLFHHHLPKLVDFGLIEFDKRTKTIRYRDDSRIESLIEYLDEYGSE
ncbi:DUF7344 domain-containing protein [Haladaptatus sp. DFWS20]|uniref:DUF7344 domain-containing protein n=1 Tax=Haladaptatus sp. DFWS20 TaxID=3403467 RepID=UPI003EBF4BDF